MASSRSHPHEQERESNATATWATPLGFGGRHLHRSLTPIAAALLSPAFLIAPAHAQPTTYIPSEAFVSLADWTFVAIEGHTNNAVTHNHLVAVSQTFAASADSIVAVMYERQSDDSWVASAWTDADVAGVVPFLEGAFGIQPEHLHRLDPLRLPHAGEGYLSNPGAYHDGLFVGDPLAWALYLDPDNRDALVEWLVEIGYPAADLPIEKNAMEGDCPTPCRLDHLRRTFMYLEALPPDASPEDVAGAIGPDGDQVIAPRTIPVEPWALPPAIIGHAEWYVPTPWTAVPCTSHVEGGTTLQSYWLCCWTRTIVFHERRRRVCFDVQGVVHTCIQTRTQTIRDRACCRFEALPSVLGPAPPCSSPVDVDQGAAWVTHPGCEACVYQP